MYTTKAIGTIETLIDVAVFGLSEIKHPAKEVTEMIRMLKEMKEETSKRNDRENEFVYNAGLRLKYYLKVFMDIK